MLAYMAPVSQKTSEAPSANIRSGLGLRLGSGLVWLGLRLGLGLGLDLAHNWPGLGSAPGRVLYVAKYTAWPLRNKPLSRIII